MLLEIPLPPIRSMVKIAVLTWMILFSWPAVRADDLAIDLPATDEHPLAPAIRYAEERCQYFREKIRDYTCRLVKRERIDGILQPYQYLEVRVRCEQLREDSVTQPLCVHLKYLAPRNLQGRQVLYVADERDGRMLVSKGGRLFSKVTFHIALNSAAARRESNYPISEIGFDQIVERLVEIAKQDMQNDPQAENTKVTYYRDAQISKRSCLHIQVQHPQVDRAFAFHQASLFIDNELRIPTRLVVYDWPRNGSSELPIIEEYTYLNPHLNVGLTDADFHESLLH